MWNPAAPETIENPFPFWAWLRKEAPLWEVPDAGYFTISRYSDLLEVSRDEAEFPEPDRFVLDRPNIKAHLGFGLGKHFCLGAALARMETRVALQALVAKKEHVTLAVDTATLRHKPSIRGVRRLQTLPVTLG